MSLQVYKLTASAVAIDDLGITITGAIGTTYDLVDLHPNNVTLSATGGDLEAAVNGTTPFSTAELVVVDPRAGYSGNLDAADSLTALRAHNDSHIGVQLASIADLDDVGGTPGANEVLEFNNGTGQWEPVSASVIGGNIALGDLSDVDDLAAHSADAPVILMGDGTNFDTVPIVGGTSITGVAVSATSWTLNVDDDFLKNTGDSLDSGTLSIAEGATLLITGDGGGGGATITIGQDAAATIETPSGGVFTNDNDIINKAYVDAVAAGLDWKESVRVGTITSDIGGTYAAGGGTGGTGAFTLLDTTSANSAFDGITLAVGDRVLVKNQTDAKQNGIYVVTVASATIGEMERAPDQDGSPASEVSAGNATFIEEGTQADTGWVISTNDPITLNTTPITWTQFSGTGAGANAFGSIVGGDGGTATADAPSDSVTYNGNGINIQGNSGASASVDFALDMPDLTDGAETLLITDSLAVYDGTATLEYTFSDVVGDLEIPNAVGTGTGWIVSNGSGAYTTRTISNAVAGNRDGIEVTNGDGSGNAVIGLDILTNAAAGEDVAAGDLFIGYNLSGTANETFTAQEMADGLFSLSGGISNAFSIITGDTGTATAIGADTITINGDGIDVVATNGGAGADTLALNLDISDLTGSTTALLTNSIAIDDGTALNKAITLTEVVGDLEIPNAVGTTAGFLVSNGSGAYTTRTISASADEDQVGLIVNANDGSANLTVGLDIVGLTDPAADLASTDEFAIHDKSEGTGGANRKITGQNVADGVMTITGLTGLTLSTVNGQTILTYEDTTRGETLSTDSFQVSYSENRVSNNDWLNIGGAVDATSGFIVPMDATIVAATMHSASVPNGATKTLNLYVDAAIPTGGSGFLSVTGTVGAPEKEDRDETLDIPVNQDQKIRVRGDAAGGTIEDTVVTLWLRWRAP